MNDWFPSSGADFGGGQFRSFDALSALFVVPISLSEVRQMGRKNPLDSVLVAVGLVILLCAATAIGIELSRFLAAIWR